MNKFKIEKDLELKEFKVQSRGTADKLAKQTTKETLGLDMKLSVIKKICDNLQAPIESCQKGLQDLETSIDERKRTQDAKDIKFKNAFDLLQEEVYNNKEDLQDEIDKINLNFDINAIMGIKTKTKKQVINDEAAEIEPLHGI